MEVHFRLEDDHLTLFVTTRFSNIPEKFLDIVIVQVQKFINRVNPLPIKILLAASWPSPSRTIIALDDICVIVILPLQMILFVLFYPYLCFSFLFLSS